VPTFKLDIKLLVFRMSFNCVNPESYEGRVIGNGQCVAFVRVACEAPASTSWSQGEIVKGSQLQPGTAIATFTNGRYPNNPEGNHAAVYIAQNAEGILVWDQWVGQPVHSRTIRFRNGQGSASNDGDRYSVIQ